MIKKFINWLQQLRKPNGVIYFHDGQWFISHVRFFDCGVELSLEEMKIKPFDDDETNVAITITSHEILTNSVITNCEFHSEGYRKGDQNE